jgi:hypothetical protein
VISSLPTSDLENATLQAPNATQTWTKSIERRRQFLTKLDQYTLYSQQLGKSSIDFKVQRIRRGVVYSEPASSIFFDIWIRPGRSGNAETNVRLRISDERRDHLLASNDPPLIVKFSPYWMKKSVISSNGLHAGYPITSALENSAEIFEGESSTNQRPMSTEWTVKAMSIRNDRRTIVWHIQQFSNSTRNDLNTQTLHVHMAVIVEHGNSPFNVDVELSESSRIQRLKKRPSVNTITILPDTGSSLEEVNLDQPEYMVEPLLEAQNVNEMEEVGLEYDGKHFTKRMKHALMLPTPPPPHLTRSSTAYS